MTRIYKIVKTNWKLPVRIMPMDISLHNIQLTVDYLELLYPALNTLGFLIQRMGINHLMGCNFNTFYKQLLVLNKFKIFHFWSVVYSARTEWRMIDVPCS